MRLAYKGLVWQVETRNAEQVRAWLDRFFPVGEGEPVRYLQTTANRFVAAAGGLVLKEAGPRPKRSRLAFGLRPSTARLLARRSLALLACGVPTHEPVAWAVRRERGLRVRDYLLTREITGTELLTRRLDRFVGDPEGRHETLAAWGRLVAALHRNRFGNRDLKDANILCSLEGPLKFWVTDLEGLRRFPWLPARVAFGDLEPVALSLRRHGWLREASDETAFFDAYNAEVPMRLRRRTLPR